jgi:hypothetical protein
LIRIVLAVLLLANVIFLAWGQGILDRLIGVSSIGDRDPARMAREIRPNAVQVKPLPAAPTDDAACLESGPYSPGEVASAEVQLASLVSPGLWRNVRQERPGQWIVYLGPFPDKEVLAQKEEDVKRTGVAYEAINERGELDYGLSLGRFGRLSEANAALDRLAQQPVLRHARVVNLVQPSAAHVLRLEAASAALTQRLQAAGMPVLKPFANCRGAEQ